MLLYCNAFAQEFFSYSEGTEFTSITVDANKNVWAGTKGKGLHHLHRATVEFIKTEVIGDNYFISSLATDDLGNLWVANSGTEFTHNVGGIHSVNINAFEDTRRYSADNNFECFDFFERDGVATRDPRCIRVDKNNKVWSAHGYHDITVDAFYAITPGSLCFKEADADIFTTLGGWNDYDNGIKSEELPYPAYTCDIPATANPGTRNCTAMAIGDTEALMSVYPYTAKDGLVDLPARVLRYDLDGNYLGAETHESMGVPNGGVFNGIYIDKAYNEFVSISPAGRGFAVKSCNEWTYMPMSMFSIAPENTRINDNAIWGNKDGDVFFGTDQGLLVYNGCGSVTNADAYTFYSTDNILPVNNILGGFSQDSVNTWLATSDGIRKVVGKFEDLEYVIVEDCSSTGDTSVAYIQDLKKGFESGINTNNRSYHKYVIETEICTKEGPEDNKCCLETVFNLMRNDVSNTAPVPGDFPLDNINPLTLQFATKNQLKAVVDNVNAWEGVRDEDSNPTGAIRTIKSVSPFGIDFSIFAVDNSSISLLAFGPSELFMKFQGLFKSLEEKQNAYNPPEAFTCLDYRLYNNINLIVRRRFFKRKIDIFFGNKLENTEYDRVYLVVEEPRFTITNYTAEGHFLYPGYVQRKVVKEGNSIKVITTGEGLQYCGDGLWGNINANGNIIVGAIIFKNIDLRLKKNFEDLE